MAVILTTPSPLPPSDNDIFENVLDFEERDEMFIYIDENGDASGHVFMRMPPSKFSEFLKTIVALTGTSAIERDYSESVQRSFAKYGLEVENLVLTVDTSGENFELEIIWNFPRIARWDSNVWDMTFSWPDNESAAKETVAEQDISWVLMRSIANAYGFEVANFTNFYSMTIVLPENSANVQSAMFGTTETTYMGGQSFRVSSVDLTQFDGRQAVVENGMTVFNTENEMTISPNDFIENSLVYTITYSGFEPDDKTFLGSLERVRLDLKYGIALRDNYPIYSDGTLFTLTPAQILYYAANAVVAENNGQPFSISGAINVASAGSESGDWDSAWKNLSRQEYSRVAQQVASDISSSGTAPSSVITSAGDIRFRDALYTFLRILSENNETGVLPENILIAPVPSGSLDWGGVSTPAENVYYLLPEYYVITNSGRLTENIENFPGGLDNRGLAEQITDWTGSNLSYGLSFTTPTSEGTLDTQTGQCRDYVNLYLAMARTAGLPARRMIGWVTSTWQPPAGWGFTSTTTPTGETVALHAWIQVYVSGEGWLQVEPQSKRPSLYVGTLPYTPYREMEQTWMGALAAYESASGNI